MDEAFRSLADLLPGLLPLTEPVVAEDGSLRMLITGGTVQTPIELDLTVSSGAVGIGAAPPLYHVETSELPVFHDLRFVLESAENLAYPAVPVDPAYSVDGVGVGDGDGGGSP